MIEFEHDLVQDDRIHRRLYTDPAIFDLEMRRIFERVWVYVGHESEIAAGGDYKTAKIGRQPVVLAREESGAINVLVNRCMHRGSIICRDEKGNSHFFRCPYHGWTYKNTGELIGVPRRQRYPDDFAIGTLDAMHVPRVETYRGLIFASFNSEIEPVIEYLAQARHVVDRILDLSLEGTIGLAPGPNRHRYPANWKFQAENGVDGYHAMFLHESFFAIQKRRADSARLAPRNEELGWTQAFDNGHALLARRLPDDEVASVRARFPEYYDALEHKVGAERFRELFEQTNLFIFPNLYLILNQVRVIQPVTFDDTIVTMTPFTLGGAPSALNELRLREHEQGFAPAGFIGPDDYAAFECVQEGLAAASVPWLVLYRGIHDEQTLPDGSRRGKPSDETPQRGMYRRYRELMNASAPA
ncbi:MAG: aromatic ring-hydroxylating dioxygenase subunit alpha [Candidatus Velthaea sp.]